MTVEHRIGASARNGRRVAIGVATKAALALEVLGFYVRVRPLLVRRGLVPTVAELRSGALVNVETGVDSARLRRSIGLGRAVAAVLGLLPTDSRCLMRALVLTGMLARRGVYARVVLGVRVEPRFAAHAWVEVDDHPVLAVDESRYRRLVEL
jgi:Transglutaminase-like superfamily